MKENEFAKKARQTRKPTSIPIEYASDIQLANRYSVCRATIWKWAQSADHPLPKPLKIGKNCTRWKLSDVIEAMEGAA